MPTAASDHTRQSLVWRDVMQQRLAGQTAIRGLMIESNINPGKQTIPADLSDLKPGVSVTDACIGWAETEALLQEAHAQMERGGVGV